MRHVPAFVVFNDLPTDLISKMQDRALAYQCVVMALVDSILGCRQAPRVQDPAVPLLGRHHPEGAYLPQIAMSDPSAQVLLGSLVRKAGAYCWDAVCSFASPKSATGPRLASARIAPKLSSRGYVLSVLCIADISPDLVSFQHLATDRRWGRIDLRWRVEIDRSRVVAELNADRCRCHAPSHA